MFVNSAVETAATEGEDRLRGLKTADEGRLCLCCREFIRQARIGGMLTFVDLAVETAATEGEDRLRGLASSRRRSASPLVAANLFAGRESEE